MISILMGEGFEEIEAITVYDVVKRIGKKASFGKPGLLPRIEHGHEGGLR